MKKRLSTLLALMLALSVLFLAACGKTNTSGDTSGQTEEKQEAPADPSEKFLGTWKLAGWVQDDITLVGDFSMLLQTEEGMGFTLKDGGAGTMFLGEDSSDIKWELKGDDSITISPVEKEEGEASADADAGEDAKADEGTEADADAKADAATDEAKSEEQEELEETVLGEDNTLEITYEEGRLVSKIEGEGFANVLYFTADGSLEGFTVINPENAKPITSDDALIGDWNLTGMNMFGVTMYGDSKAFEGIVGDGTDISASFAKDGTAKLMGVDVKWSTSADGATVDFGDDMTVPVLSLDDMILIDMSQAFGVDIYMAFGK